MFRRFLLQKTCHSFLPLPVALQFNNTIITKNIYHFPQQQQQTRTAFRFCNTQSTTTTEQNEEIEQQQQQEEIIPKRGDYFRIDSLEAATPPPEVIEWRSARGSGPGGQGVNSSQNKAELRVNLNLWFETDPTTFDFETLEKLRKDFSGMITKDDILIVASHAHRSLEKNKLECMEKVKKMVREASYVPPLPTPKMQFDPNYVKKVVLPKKRMKSNFNKMKRSVRAGTW